MSSRRSEKRATGKMAVMFALATGIAALVGCGMLTALLVNNLGGTSRAWALGLALSLVVAVIVAIVAWVQASATGTRVTDLALAVAKLGRGGTEVRVRVSGSDEVAALGRTIQYLATDLADLLKQDDSHGALATLDPHVRELRDRALPAHVAPVEDYEVDGGISAGSRGGLDYFDAVPATVGAVLYLVSGEGQSSLSVLACRLARDELHRALEAGATPRKALSHTNRVMKKTLPSGACAKVSVLHLLGDDAKLYQAGARAPLLICARGEILELSAEGLALGLDEGPVFEKALRPERIDLSTGIRLVLCNEAAMRLDGFLELLERHSPMHTAPFMNMVLGSLEEEAGEGGLREDVVLLTAKRS